MGFGHPCRLEPGTSIRNLAEVIEFNRRPRRERSLRRKLADYSRSASVHRSIAIAFALTLSCVAATASAEQCEDKVQQDKSQQNSADEAQVRGDLKAGSQCATPGDKDESQRRTRTEPQSSRAKGRWKTTPLPVNHLPRNRSQPRCRVCRLYCATEAQEFSEGRPRPRTRKFPYPLSLGV